MMLMSALFVIELLNFPLMEDKTDDDSDVDISVSNNNNGGFIGMALNLGGSDSSD